MVSQCGGQRRFHSMFSSHCLHFHIAIQVYISVLGYKLCAQWCQARSRVLYSRVLTVPRVQLGASHAPCTYARATRAPPSASSWLSRSTRTM
jgi:hypothetical protein